MKNKNENLIYIYTGKSEQGIANYFSEKYSYNNKCDYNLYYGSGGLEKTVWSGQDKNSIFQKPKFINENQFNFHQLFDCPSIDSGININGLDIGDRLMEITMRWRKMILARMNVKSL